MLTSKPGLICLFRVKGGTKNRSNKTRKNRFKSPWVQCPLQLSSAHRSKGTRPKAFQGNHTEDSQIISRAGRYHWNWMQNIFRLSLLSFQTKSLPQSPGCPRMWLLEQMVEVQRRYLLSHRRSCATRMGRATWFMDYATSQEEITSFSNLTITNLFKKRGKEKVKPTYHSNNLQVL